MSTERLEIFSDAIFAIVMTLLVLDLHVPNVPNHSSLAQYAAAVAPQIPKFVSFVLTFILIAIYWVGHHYFYQHIKAVPIGIVWLNILLLLWISIMPYPTALLGDHPTDQFPILLYAVNQLLAAVTFFASRIYASGHHLIKGDEDVAKTMAPRHSLPAVTLFTVSILFAFMNVYFSLACFLIVPLLYFVPYLVPGRKAEE